MAFENPVLPYAAYNNPVAGVVAAAESALKPKVWTETVLPIGAGVLGTIAGGGVVYGLSAKLLGAQTGILGSVQRVGSSLVASSLLSAVSLIATKRKDIAGKVMAGGLLTVGLQLILEIFGIDVWSEVLGMQQTMSGLAMDLTDELKQRIASSVRGEIQAAEGAPVGASAFVSTQELQAAPALGPGPAVQGMDAFQTTQDLATAPNFEASPADAAVVADLDTYSHAGMDQMLV
jgi:hypothetical protein